MTRLADLPEITSPAGGDLLLIARASDGKWFRMTWATLMAATGGVVPLTYTTPTTTRGGGDTGNLNAFSTDSAAFNIEFTTGSDITTGQVVWETGGSGIGAALGVSGGNLEVYSGSTGTLQTSYAIAANTSYHVTLIIDMTADELRLYVSSDVPTSADLVTTTAWTEGDWAGTDSTGVGSAIGTTRSPYSGSFLGTVDSLLRLWATNDITTTYE